MSTFITNPLSRQITLRSYNQVIATWEPSLNLTLNDFKNDFMTARLKIISETIQFTMYSSKIISLDTSECPNLK